VELETTWYVRNKGRVVGPFTRTELADLRRRGQLSRVSEISVDRLWWVRADELPGLFERAPVSARSGSETEPALGHTGAKTAETVVLPPAADTSFGQVDWYYNQDGDRIGPVSYPELRALISRGQVLAQTLVWNETLTAWTPYSQATSLLTLVPESTDASNSHTSSPFFSRLRCSVCDRDLDVSGKAPGTVTACEGCASRLVVPVWGVPFSTDPGNLDITGDPASYLAPRLRGEGSATLARALALVCVPILLIIQLVVLCFLRGSRFGLVRVANPKAGILGPRPNELALSAAGAFLGVILLLAFLLAQLVHYRRRRSRVSPIDHHACKECNP
jgi:hypothetical protein